MTQPLLNAIAIQRLLAATELEVSSDEDEPRSKRLKILHVNARVTWAVPECERICIEFVGKGRPVEARRKRKIFSRGTLQDQGGDEERDIEDDDHGAADAEGEILSQYLWMGVGNDISNLGL